MANQIVLKKSSVAAKVPLATDLTFGELALNYADGKLYFKKSDGTTIDYFPTASSATGTWGISITGSAPTLTTARTFTIGNTGKSFNGSANLSWTTDEIGAEYQQTLNVPRANLGTPTVREVALIDEQFTNKLSFYDINNVFFETSTDNVNWTTYSVSDTDKRKFVGGDNNSGIFIPNGTAYFRIRVRAVNAYVYLNAFYAYTSTSGHNMQVQVYKKHDLDASWTAVAASTNTVSTWPGHVYLPHSTIPFNPSATQGTHVHEVYVVFIPNWNAAYPSNNIALYRGQWWGGYPAGKRNPYSIDENAQITLPGALVVPGASTFAKPITSTNDINVDGSNIVVNTTTKNSSLYAVDVRRSNTTVGGIKLDGSIVHTGLSPTDGTNIDQIKTLTKSLTLTTDWQDTGIKSTDLATGTYLVQLFANDTGSGGTNSNEYYSGTMSWYSGDTNSGLELPTDEIVLHRAGGSGEGALYLRTYRTATADVNDLKLQIYSNTANASAANYVFKFRRMI